MNKYAILALLVSLGLNLLLFGFILGRDQFGPPPVVDPVRGQLEWLRTLPPERQAQLREGAPRHLGRMQWRALRSRHNQFREALIAQPFDPQKLEQTLLALRTEQGALIELSHTGFVEMVSELSLQEREALAEFIARRPRLGGPPGRRHGPRLMDTSPQ